jgi:hypothetical protein
MKLALTAVAVLLLAGPAMAAPGDPRTVRGSLEWPASLSAEPFVVVRGDDGRPYYADVSSAQRMNAGAISGRISLVGVEGTQPHEVHAVVIGAGDSALTFATPTVPTPAEAAAGAPSSLPRQAITPPPPGAVPSAQPPAQPPAVQPTPMVPRPAVGEDLWQVQGKVVSVTPREFVVQTKPGDTVRVDVTKLSPWTRDAVRPGDQVKLFGVPQKDRRLVANGFIQEVPTTPSAATGSR